jgi:hypothetical protein
MSESIPKTWRAESVMSGTASNCSAGAFIRDNPLGAMHPVDDLKPGVN